MNTTIYLIVIIIVLLFMINMYNKMEGFTSSKTC